MGQEWVRDKGTQERQQTGGGATQTHRTREPHQEGQGRAQQTRRRGAARQERQPGQGTRMEGMGERAHGRQRQKRGWPLPGARATPAQPASGGGCLPQPRWAVCATGAGVHQGQTSPEGKGHMVDGRDNARRSRAPGPHAHGNTARHVMDAVDRGTWTADTVKRPRQQPAQPQYAKYWAPLTCNRHTMPHPAQPRHTNHWAPRTRKRHQQEHWPQRLTESSNPMQHAKGRTGACPGPRKETTTRRNVTQGVPIPRLVPTTPCPTTQGIVCAAFWHRGSWYCHFLIGSKSGIFCVVQAGFTGGGGGGG